MSYAIWAICFGLLFLFFLSTPHSKASDVQAYCYEQKEQVAEALKVDYETACARTHLSQDWDK